MIVISHYSHVTSLGKLKISPMSCILSITHSCWNKLAKLNGKKSHVLCSSVENWKSVQYLSCPDTKCVLILMEQYHMGVIPHDSHVTCVLILFIPGIFNSNCWFTWSSHNKNTFCFIIKWKCKNLECHKGTKIILHCSIYKCVHKFSC